MKTAVVLLILAIGLVKCQAEDSDEAVVIDAISDDYDNGADQSNIICGANEQYSQCNANPLCQRTCETLGDDSIPCPRDKSCIEGCICQEDYVRNQYYGTCVHNNRCPRVKH